MKDLTTVYTEYESTYSEPNLRSKGREDGEKGVPFLDSQGLSPYESEILNGAKVVASRVVGHYRGKLEEVDANSKSIKIEADERLKSEEARIDETFAAHKAQYENSVEVRMAKENYEQSKKRFDVMFGKVGRMPIRYVPHWLYVVFATLIFLGEIPLNAMVFQIFGENQVMTWVMAFVIGLSIPLSAHFIGIKSREHYPTVNWPNVAKALGFTTLIVVALYGLSTMRHDYLLAMKDELGLSSDLIETSYLFFWLNLAVFGAAIILAYLSHDPVAGYAELESELAQAKKALTQAENKVAESLKWVNSARASEREKARAAHRATIAECTKLEGVYDQLLFEGREEESRCAYQMMKDISVYRHENLRARKDQKTPASFAIEPSFPLVLTGIKEKLQNETQ